MKDGRIVDLNFATAWYMAQTGEAEPQRLADALVPDTMLEFLRTGLRASHTAEELFLGAGPHPADWWRRDPPPRGPNDETLVYLPADVRLCAPVEEESAVGPDSDLPRASETATACAAAITAINGVAGFTLMLACGPHTALGPCVTTPDDIKGALEISLRVNGEERAKGAVRPTVTPDSDKPRPGRVVRCLPDGWGPISVNAGDVVELESPAIGRLTTRIVEQSLVQPGGRL
jgi:hypothetical protein